MIREREFFIVQVVIVPILILLLVSMTWTAPRPGSLTGSERDLKLKIISHEHFDGNNIDCLMTNNGAIVDSRVYGSSAMMWPKGTDKFIDYASGLWLAGIGHDNGRIYMACVEYASELVPGPVDGNSQDEDYRIYKINSDGTGDWDVWPIDQGAPSQDGQPNLLGDQTLFWVCNDGDAAQHSNVFATSPMDVEFQITVFGFEQDDPLGDVMFVKWTIINQGTRQFDSCFVALWDDPDLGDASDDLVGCDTTLSLGYCYNGRSADGTYGVSPPAIGFDFLQGPKVPCGSRNYLPLTAFAWYWNGAPDPFDDPEIPSEAYWFMNGYTGDGTPYTDSQSNITSPFPLAGDPVTGSGDIDGVTQGPGDRRFLMSSGPFTLTPGDTQIVVGAKVIAQATNNLDAIMALRAADVFAQNAYDNDFLDVPENWAVEVSYPQPSQAEIQVQVGLENVGQVSVDLYDHHEQFIAEAQLFDDGAHNDQGENDWIWGNSLLIPCHGTALYMNLSDVHAVFGARSWPQMQTNITVAGHVKVSDFYVGLDHINSDGLVNPAETVRYTIGLHNQTDFDFHDLTVEQCLALESSCVYGLLSPNGNKIFDTLNSGQILTWNYDSDSCYYQFTLSPEAPAGDSVHLVFRMTDGDYNLWYDTLAVFVAPIAYLPQYDLMDLVDGQTDGRLEYMIFDPTSLTGHSYELSFHEQMDELIYDLRDVTLGSTLLFDQEFPDIYGLNSFPIDGFRVIKGTAVNVTYACNWNWSPSESRWLSWVNAGLGTFGGGVGVGREFFGSTLREWEYKDVRIDFDDTGATTTNCKVYERPGYTVKPGLGTFPGSAWDVDSDSPRRLNICFVENVGSGIENMQWDVDDTDVGGRELLFIMNSDYDPVTAGEYGNDEPMWGPASDVLFALWTRLRGGHLFLESSAEFTLYVNPCLVHVGDVFGFTPVWSGVEGEGEGEDQIPQSFSLNQNYPNPFNPVTTIQYALPQVSQVQLIIYNVTGQRVAILVDECQGAGLYQVRWDGGEYASGVYFYRLQAGDFTKTRKMVLLK